jgi:hypothetical protein
MTRLVIAFASLALGLGVAGCGGKSSSSTTPAQDGPKPAVLAKKVSLSWGLVPVTTSARPVTDVFLALTDETAKQKSHSIGRYVGTCSVIEPAKEMNALTGVRCEADGEGFELHVATRGGDEIIVFEGRWREGEALDPMSREPILHLKVQLGVAITVENP